MAGPLDKSSSFWHAKAAIAKNFANRKPPIDVDTRDTLCQIARGLYLSSCHLEAQRGALQRQGVTHVLQVGKELSPTHPAAFTYKNVPVYDLEEEDLVKYFPECFAFIDGGRETGAVLVHCAAGVSRSASVVIGYLMATGGLSLEDARAAVKASRPAINPNQGFLLQLQLFQDAGCSAQDWQPWDLDRFLRVRAEVYSQRNPPAALAASEAVSSGSLMRGACELAPPTLSREDSISPNGSPKHSPARASSSDGQSPGFGEEGGDCGSDAGAALPGGEPAALAAPPGGGGVGCRRMSTGQVLRPGRYLAGGVSSSSGADGAGAQGELGTFSGFPVRSASHDSVGDAAARGFGQPLPSAFGGAAGAAATAAAASTWAAVVAGGGRGVAAAFWRPPGPPCQGEAASPVTAGQPQAPLVLRPPPPHAFAPAPSPSPIPAADAVAASALPPPALPLSRSFLRQLSADDAVAQAASTGPPRPAVLSLPNNGTAVPSTSPRSPAGSVGSHSSPSPSARTPAVVPPGAAPEVLVPFSGPPMSPRAALAGAGGTIPPRARTISGVADAGAVAAWAATQAHEAATTVWAPTPAPLPIWAKSEGAWANGARAASGNGFLSVGPGPGPPDGQRRNGGVGFGPGEGSGRAIVNLTGYGNWAAGRLSNPTVSGDGARLVGGGGGAAAPAVPDPRVPWSSYALPHLALPPMPDPHQLPQPPHQHQDQQQQRSSQPPLESGAPPALSPIPSDGGCSDETCRSEADEDGSAGAGGRESTSGGRAGTSARQLRLADLPSAAPGGRHGGGGNGHPVLRRSLSDKLQGLLERAFPPSPQPLQPTCAAPDADQAAAVAAAVAAEGMWYSGEPPVPGGGHPVATRPHALSDGAAVATSGGLNELGGTQASGSAGGAALVQSLVQHQQHQRQQHQQQEHQQHQQAAWGYSSSQGAAGAGAAAAAGLAAAHPAALRLSTDSGASSGALAPVWPDGSGSEGSSSSSSGGSTATSRAVGGDVGGGAAAAAPATASGGGYAAEEGSDATSGGAGDADSAAAVSADGNLSWRAVGAGPDSPDAAPADGLRRRWALLPILTPAGLERTPSKLPPTQQVAAAVAATASVDDGGDLAAGAEIAPEDGSECEGLLPTAWPEVDPARSAALSHLVAAHALSHGAMTAAAVAVVAAASAAAASAAADGAVTHVRAEPEILASRTPSTGSAVGSPRSAMPGVYGFASPAAAAAAGAGAAHPTPGKAGACGGAKAASRLATATFAHAAWSGIGGTSGGGVEGLDGCRTGPRRREYRSSSGASGISAGVDEPPAAATASYDQPSGSDTDVDAWPSLQRSSAPSAVMAGQPPGSVAATAAAAAALLPADSGASPSPSPTPAMAVPARPLRLSIRGLQGSGGAGGAGGGGAAAAAADAGREGGSGTPIHKRVLRSLTSFLNRSPESPTLTGNTQADAAAGSGAAASGARTGGSGESGSGSVGGGGGDSGARPSITAALRRRLWSGGRTEMAAEAVPTATASASPPYDGTRGGAAAVQGDEAAATAPTVAAAAFAAMGSDYFAEEPPLVAAAAAAATVDAGADTGATAAAAAATVELQGPPGWDVLLRAGTLVRSEVLLPPAASALPCNSSCLLGEDSSQPPPPQQQQQQRAAWSVGLALRTHSAADAISSVDDDDDNDNDGSARDGSATGTIAAPVRSLLRSRSSSPTCAEAEARPKPFGCGPSAGSSTVSGVTLVLQPGLSKGLDRTARGGGGPMQDVRGLDLADNSRAGRVFSEGCSAVATAAVGRGGGGGGGAGGVGPAARGAVDHAGPEGEVIGLEMLPEAPFRWDCPGLDTDEGLTSGRGAAHPAGGADAGAVAVPAVLASPRNLGREAAVGAAARVLTSTSTTASAASAPGVDAAAARAATAAAAYFSSLAAVASAALAPGIDGSAGAVEPLQTRLPAVPAATAAAFRSRQTPGGLAAAGPVEMQRSSSAGAPGLPAVVAPGAEVHSVANGWSEAAAAAAVSCGGHTGRSTTTGTGSGASAAAAPAAAPAAAAAATRRPRSSYSGALSMLQPNGHPGHEPRVTVSLLSAAGWPPPPPPLPGVAEGAQQTYQRPPANPAAQGPLSPSPLSSPLPRLQPPQDPQLTPNRPPQVLLSPQPQQTNHPYGLSAVAALAGMAAARGIALPAWGGSRSSASLLSTPSDPEPPETHGGPVGQPDAAALDAAPGRQPPLAGQHPPAVSMNGGPAGVSGPSWLPPNRATVRSSSTGSSAAAHAAAAAAGSLAGDGASGPLDHLRAARQHQLQLSRLKQQQLQQLQQDGGAPFAAVEAGDPQVGSLARSHGPATAPQADGGSLSPPKPTLAATAAASASGHVPVAAAAAATAAPSGLAPAPQSPLAASIPAAAIRLSLSPTASSGGSSTSVQSPRAPPAVPDALDIDPSLDGDWSDGQGLGLGTGSRQAADAATSPPAPAPIPAASRVWPDASLLKPVLGRRLLPMPSPSHIIGSPAGTPRGSAGGAAPAAHAGAHAAQHYLFPHRQNPSSFGTASAPSVVDGPRPTGRERTAPEPRPTHIAELRVLLPHELGTSSGVRQGTGGGSGAEAAGAAAGAPSTTPRSTAGGDAAERGSTSGGGAPLPSGGSSTGRGADQTISSPGAWSGQDIRSPSTMRGSLSSSDDGGPGNGPS